MVEGVGEHTLAAADEEALDATKQEEWRARRDSPARVVVVSLGYRERVRERANKEKSRVKRKKRLEMAVANLSYVAVRRENGMEGTKAVAVSSMIEDRPKIEVLSWRVATFTDPRHHQNERHSPHKPWITPSKNVPKPRCTHPTNHTQQIGEAIKARRDRWYKRSTAGGDWSFESAVCHSHAEKVTPTNGLHPNDSRVQGEMNNAKKLRSSVLPTPRH